ncbi:hypothetical protein [Pseudomonas anguilliseptica]|uniref:hypothetical protein n=1 Tax=Pseudomonas anguilliseptica TaxID=53406 RepID=UPI00325BD0B6
MSYGLLGLKSQMEGESIKGLEELGQQQHQNKMFKDQADQQQKAQRKQSQVGMATTGVMLGAQVGGPWGAVIGGVVGLAAGSFM